MEEGIDNKEERPLHMHGVTTFDQNIERNFPTKGKGGFAPEIALWLKNNPYFISPMNFVIAINSFFTIASN